MALAFANPFVNRTVARDHAAARNLILAVDHSFSMRYGITWPAPNRKRWTLLSQAGLPDARRRCSRSIPRSAFSPN